MTTGPWKAAASNPDVIQLRALAKSTQGKLADAVSSHVGSIDARIDALNSLRRRTGASMEILPAMAEEEMRLERRVSSLASMGDDLRRDFQRARMAEEVEAGDIEVVALAPLPSSPLVSAAALKLAMGIVLGLGLGLILAYVLEALNTSIRRPEDLEAALHVPGLAVIPRAPATVVPASAGCSACPMGKPGRRWARPWPASRPSPSGSRRSATCGRA
jgi:hypothetical protein